MSARERLLNAMDTAAQAHLDYLQSRISYRAYSRAMDHVAVCRDAAGLDFFRVVRLPERAPEVFREPRYDALGHLIGVV